MNEQQAAQLISAVQGIRRELHGIRKSLSNLDADDQIKMMQDGYTDGVFANDIEEMEREQNDNAKNKNK